MKKKTFIFFATILFTFCFSFRNTYASDSLDDDLAEVAVEEGIYEISFGADDNMVIEITDASTKPSANVQLGKGNSSPSQYFAILKEYNGWYTIRNLNSQCNLDVANFSPEPQTNLQQWLCHGNDAQQFKFYDAGNEQIYIKSKLGTCIDLADGDAIAGNNIQLYNFNGSIAQKWRLTMVQQPLTSIDITDGNYVLCSEENQELCLSIAHASKIAGAEIQTNICTENSSQIYTIKKGADGWYSIQSINSHLYFDIVDASQTADASLRQWIGNGLNSQKFKFYDAGNGCVIIGTRYGTVLEHSESSGDAVLLALYTGSSIQLWKLQSL